MIATIKKILKKTPAQRKAGTKKSPAEALPISVAPSPVSNADTAIKKLDVQATMAKAISLHEKGRRREAYLTCELILRVRPQHASALHLMGVIAIENQDFPLAMKLISESLSIDSENASAHNNLGVVYRILKDSLAAAAHFEKAVSLRADYAEAFNNFGVALGDLNRPEDALKQFSRALEIKPDYQDAKTNKKAVLSWSKATKNRSLQA